jgi:hypothetical protein
VPTQVTVFVVPRVGSGAVPRPAEPVEVAASEHDAARAEARIVLEAAGHRVRALTFGTRGLVAYVEESAS